jgi:tungstate transport system permease protein
VPMQERLRRGRNPVIPDLWTALALAFQLVASANPELNEIVHLSLVVSGSASILAFTIGTPCGALLAVSAFRGRKIVLVIVNALLGLPPVVVGLVVYLLISRSGPLGSLGLLFTPVGMVLAQTVLALPIVIALTHRAVTPLWKDHGDDLTIDGAGTLRAIQTLLNMARISLVTVFLAAFGRAIAEVGAIMMVGGNIRGYTRTMTTTIALETSKGDLPLALALGMILIGISLLVSAVAFSLDREKRG